MTRQDLPESRETRVRDRGSRIPIWLLFLVAVLIGACGKKGPPLAPLNLVPEPPSAVSGRRVAATVYVQMLAPKKNANGPGNVALDHLEVYAVTVGPGLIAPPNRELMTHTYLVGRIDIKPILDDEEQPADETEKDTRPGPGDKVTFVEALTEKQLQSAPGLNPVPPVPVVDTLKLPVTVGLPPELFGEARLSVTEGLPPELFGEARPATAAAATPEPSVPVRIYIARGVTRKGRPGPPSTRVTLALVPPPPPPGEPSASFSERAISLTWIAPAPPLGGAPAMAFNVYSASKSPAAASPQTAALPAAPAPLNDTPISGTTFEHPEAQPGVERCFEIRTVEKPGDTWLESEATPPVCVTPRDIFPPAAPKGLALVALDGGVMNLIWDANTEPDLGGYLVLRGEAPGDTLQPLTPQPIRETSFRDATVKPGVRYVYAVVAVDRATPPNRSAPSNRQEETAR